MSTRRQESSNADFSTTKGTRQMPIMKRYRAKHAAIAIGVMLLALVASACSGAEQQPKVAPSSMEVVQGAYLHLTTNITDLRTRVTNWQNGDEGSLGVAKEKVDRIKIVLDSTGWPKEMAKSVARTRAAVAPMDKALKSEDKAAAGKASAEFGEASHDIIHEFYGDFLPAMEGMVSNSMAAHVVYHDLTNNIADLQTRIANWQKGDEGSMGVAKEKAERIEIIIPHMYATGVVATDLPPIQRALPQVFAAIDKKDAGATAQAARPILDASKVLGKDFSTWMTLERAATTDPACVEASYLDVTREITDLRNGITAWGKGDVATLSTVTDKAARIDLLIAHTAWPQEMAPAIARTMTAMSWIATAIKDRNAAAADAASAELGEGSHDITHTYYGDWLPAGGLQGASSMAMSMAMPMTSSQPQAASASAAGGHSHGGSTTVVAAPEGPNWAVIAGFIAVMGLVVGGAGLTKPRGSSASKSALPSA